MSLRKTAQLVQAVMPNRFSACFTFAAVLFVARMPEIFTVDSSALAAPRADSWTLAQQAFARLDYQNAYRYALESLKISPKNSDARRLAAKSAKELQRYPECLRLIQDAGSVQATNDDVGLVGECAALSQYTSWSLGFLQQNVNVAANHDIASFWLGRYFYRKGDYLRAEKTLKDVVVLPARLEKERVFMFERIREVLRVSQPQTSAEKLADESTSTPVTSAPSPLPASKTSGAREPKREATSRESSPESASRRDLNGGFFIPNAAARVGFALFNGKRTPFGPDDQPAFEASNPTSAAGAIKTNSIGLADLYADARASGLAGYATPMGSHGLQLKMAVEGIVSATQSNNILPFYAPIGEAVRPTLAVRIPAKGGSGSLGGSTDFAINRNFALGGFGQYQISSPGFKYQLSKMLTEGFAKLEFEEYQIRPFANYILEIGQDGKTAGIGNQWGADFKIARIGFFGFGSPLGYPLVRYSRFQPIGRTKSVFLFTQNEGQFWEVNVAPRAYFSDSFNVMSWYRYVTGSRQSYVSGSTRDKIQTGGTFRLFQPSSDYTSVGSDWTTEVEWTPHKNWSIGAGILLRKLVTTYSEDSALDETQQYSTLLDRAGESFNRYFIEGRLQF